MPRAHAENVIKNIISAIVREGARRGHALSDTLVAFMVKAVVLDPRNGFNADQTLTKQDIEKLEELCLNRLMEKCSPSLDTIKMQVYFDMSYTSRREFLEEIHRLVESRLSPMSREITDSRVKTREELDALYRTIIGYIMLRSAMGPPSNASALQEATAALQSVFPHSELGAFMVLLKRDKEQQLSELSLIVTGIRLFNKASQKGGEESDLQELITSKSIENELSAAQSLAWKYTAVLEKLTAPDSQPECAPPTALLRQALYNVRQHEVFLQMLLADVRLCVSHVDILKCELRSQLELLKDTVKFKSAVPTAKVFPLFKTLSKLWHGLQDEAELLNILHNIMLNMQPFVASQAKMFPEAYLDGLLGASEVKTDEQRMTVSSDECIAPAEVKAQDWLLHETTAGINELPLQYNGMCGYTLVSRDGLLLPGNPHIGVLKHKEKLYAFSSKEAALNFACSSDSLIAEVAEKAKLFPELIQLLQLHRQFSCVSHYPEMQPGESLLVKPITKCESGTQTDIHPVETNMDKSYEWNEWQLRRKAISLADVRTKVTHSAQTDLSHMRRENASQTWLPKDVACQSKRDGESNMAKPQSYLAGLRGHKEAHVVKTNLTRPVDE